MKSILQRTALSGMLVYSFTLLCQLGHPKAALIRKNRLDNQKQEIGPRFRAIEQEVGSLRKIPNRVVRRENEFFLVNQNGDALPLIIEESSGAKTNKHLFYIGTFRDLDKGRFFKAYIEKN